MRDRNNSVDLFRTLAAFAVVCIHSNYGKLDPTIVNGIVLSTRWAVPFFFLITGYYLFNQLNSISSFPKKAVAKLISIHIVSSFIFILVRILNNDSLDFGLVNLLNGTYFHLWFIGSMILGLVFIWYMYQINLQKLLGIISISILIVTTFTDGYDILISEHISYMPFLISIPFMHIGMLLRKHQYKLPFTILIMFVIGLFTLQFFENYLLNLFSDKFVNQALSISTIVFVIFLFQTVLKIKINKENYLIKIGRKYSLFIYLFHPIFFLVFQQVARASTEIRYYLFNGLQPILIFIITLSLGLIINKISPFTFNLLNGQINRL